MTSVNFRRSLNLHVSRYTTQFNGNYRPTYRIRHNTRRIARTKSRLTNNRSSARLQSTIILNICNIRVRNSLNNLLNDTHRRRSLITRQLRRPTVNNNRSIHARNFRPLRRSNRFLLKRPSKRPHMTSRIHRARNRRTKLQTKQ